MKKLSDLEYFNGREWRNFGEVEKDTMYILEYSNWHPVDVSFTKSDSKEILKTSQHILKGPEITPKYLHESNYPMVVTDYFNEANNPWVLKSLITFLLSTIRVDSSIRVDVYGNSIIIKCIDLNLVSRVVGILSEHNILPESYTIEEGYDWYKIKLSSYLISSVLCNDFIPENWWNLPIGHYKYVFNTVYLRDCLTLSYSNKSNVSRFIMWMYALATGLSCKACVDFSVTFNKVSISPIKEFSDILQDIIILSEYTRDKLLHGEILVRDRQGSTLNWVNLDQEVENE